MIKLRHKQPFVFLIILVGIGCSFIGYAKLDDPLSGSESNGAGLIAPPIAASGAVGGVLGAGQATQSSAGAAGQQSRVSDSSGGRASAFGKSANVVSRSGAMKAYKKGGKKRGHASVSGYSSRFGKKGGKYMTYGSGHRRAYATIKTFHHAKGFKYGQAGLRAGSKRGYKAKKGYLRQAGAIGAQQHSRGGSKAFASGESSKAASKKVAATSAGQKSGSDSQGASVVTAGKKVVATNFAGR